jgi:hypothetical protein
MEQLFLTGQSLGEVERNGVRLREGGGGEETGGEGRLRISFARALAAAAAAGAGAVAHLDVHAWPLIGCLGTP